MRVLLEKASKQCMKLSELSVLLELQVLLELRVILELRVLLELRVHVIRGRVFLEEIR